MSRIKVRKAILITSFLFIPFLLLSCSSDKNNNQTTSTSGSGNNGDVTLNILISDTADNSGFRAVIEAIEQELNIKTNVELRPGGPEGVNIVKTRLATGGMPDLIVYNSGSLLKALNPEKHFIDLSDETFMEKIVDSYIEVVSDNNKAFGIPVQSSQVGAWFYNKKVYEELGLQIPKTWDELMENNDIIKAAGKTAVIGTYGELWTSQLPILADFYNLQAEIPNFAEEYTAGKAKYATTPAARRGFERIEEIGKKKYMNEDYTVATYDQGMQLLAEGDGVHYPMLAQMLPIIAEKYPDKINDIGVFPQPSDNPEINGLTVWMPDTILISKESQNVETAKKWMEFYISKKGIELYETKQKSVGPYVLEDIEIPEDSYEAVKDMAKYFDAGNVTPALEFVSPIKGPNLAQLCTSVGSGTMKASEAAKSYDKDVEKQAKQLGLEW
ncbi:ABC transporter substrate-binding protein [Lederbergia sp. NSJ-179]|uniref:ABC transporter substrate-binding protein n=1 Tax=Lederbergia sp. NSJ-179 TaxID=2931402 RepID=UPI001FD3A0E9|nr:ABC transporter substrate-binding protein [Lederbergia sp. NSJ-179]MCJ7842858.1 ABC transporter substrate-binding protein [Lederbergia sp. NSJ-179]